MVERMKRAGAIIIGKTNTPEFGLGSNTYNDVFGRTLNAYDQIETRADRAAAPASRSRCTCCRSPTAATTAARCAIPPPGTTCSASARLTAACRRKALDVFYAYDGRAGSDGAQRAGPRHAAVGAGGLRPAPAAVEPAGSGAIRGRRSGATSRARASPGSAISAAICRSSRACSTSAKSALKVFEALGCIGRGGHARLSDRTGLAELAHAARLAVRLALKALYNDPAKRALMKPEALFEVESGQKLSAYEIYDARAVRSAWYQAVRAFFERYDYFILPSGAGVPVRRRRWIGRRHQRQDHGHLSSLDGGDDAGHDVELPGARRACRF